MSELLPIILKTPQSGRTFALNPALIGVQNLFNAGRAAIVANTGTLDHSCDKSAGQCQLRSIAGLAVFALRSDSSMAGNCRERRQCGTCGMGRSRCGLDRKHELNSNSMFTCISTAGIALFLIRADFVSTERDFGGSNPNLWLGPAIVWADGRRPTRSHRF